MAQEKMIKLGTFNEYTPHGNSFDASDESLNYNDSNDEKEVKEEEKAKD